LQKKKGDNPQSSSGRVKSRGHCHTPPGGRNPKENSWPEKNRRKKDNIANNQLPQKWEKKIQKSSGGGDINGLERNNVAELMKEKIGLKYRVAVRLAKY